MKTYNVSDLFFTRWEDLTPKMHATVYTLQQELLSTPRVEGSSGQASIKYGVRLIGVLRHLRKNKTLVDKLIKVPSEKAVMMVVDIYNDLKFLNEPWYYFPDLQLSWGKTPEAYLARHTFDHFIYADNEFTSYMATREIKYLRRLVATLYQERFDKEDVADLETKVKCADWQMILVFFTFANVREFVTKRCKALLPKPPVSEEESPEEKKITATGRLWLTLKYRLAETLVFQGYDTTGRANMYSALDYLEDLAKQKTHGGN